MKTNYLKYYLKYRQKQRYMFYVGESVIKYEIIHSFRTEEMLLSNLSCKVHETKFFSTVPGIESNTSALYAVLLQMSYRCPLPVECESSPSVV